MARWDATPSRSNDRSVDARVDSIGYVRLLGDSSEEDDELTHAAIFEVKIGKKVEGASQIPESEQLIRSTMTWSPLHFPFRCH